MVRASVILLLILTLGYCAFYDDEKSSFYKSISPSPEEEAYEIGYAIGFFENCSKSGPRLEVAPPTIDDSLEGGRLSAQYTRGYWDAVRLEPCIRSGGRLR